MAAKRGPGLPRARPSLVRGVAARAGLTADFAHPEADLSRYRLIVAPALYLTTERAAANLRRYVEGGGTLVVSCFSGIVDDRDRVYPGPYRGALRDVLGLTRRESGSRCARASESPFHLGRTPACLPRTRTLRLPGTSASSGLRRARTRLRRTSPRPQASRHLAGAVPLDGPHVGVAAPVPGFADQSATAGSFGIWRGPCRSTGRMGVAPPGAAPAAVTVSAHPDRSSPAQRAGGHRGRLDGRRLSRAWRAKPVALVRQRPGGRRPRRHPSRPGRGPRLVRLRPHRRPGPPAAVLAAACDSCQPHPAPPARPTRRTLPGSPAAVDRSSPGRAARATRRPRRLAARPGAGPPHRRPAPLHHAHQPRNDPRHRPTAQPHRHRPEPSDVQVITE